MSGFQHKDSNAKKGKKSLDEEPKPVASGMTPWHAGQARQFSVRDFMVRCGPFDSVLRVSVRGPIHSDVQEAQAKVQAKADRTAKETFMNVEKLVGQIVPLPRRRLVIGFKKFRQFALSIVAKQRPWESPDWNDDSDFLMEVAGISSPTRSAELDDGEDVLAAADATQQARQDLDQSHRADGQTLGAVLENAPSLLDTKERSWRAHIGDMIVLDDKGNGPRDIKVGELLDRWDEIGRHASRNERITMTKKQTKRALWLPKQPLVVDADPVVEGGYLLVEGVRRDKEGSVWLRGRPSFAAHVLQLRPDEGQHDDFHEPLEVKLSEAELISLSAAPSRADLLSLSRWAPVPCNDVGLGQLLYVGGKARKVPTDWTPSQLVLPNRLWVPAATGNPFAVSVGAGANTAALSSNTAPKSDARSELTGGSVRGPASASVGHGEHIDGVGMLLPGKNGRSDEKGLDRGGYGPGTDLAAGVGDIILGRGLDEKHSPAPLDSAVSSDGMPSDELESDFASASVMGSRRTDGDSMLGTANMYDIERAPGSSVEYVHEFALSSLRRCHVEAVMVNNDEVKRYIKADIQEGNAVLRPPQLGDRYKLRLKGYPDLDLSVFELQALVRGQAMSVSPYLQYEFEKPDLHLRAHRPNGEQAGEKADPLAHTDTRKTSYDSSSSGSSTHSSASKSSGGSGSKKKPSSLYPVEEHKKVVEDFTKDEWTIVQPKVGEIKNRNFVRKSAWNFLSAWNSTIK